MGEPINQDRECFGRDTAESWLFCPGCGTQGSIRRKGKRLRCRACGFRYFHNPAVAVAAVIRCQDEVLFAVRDREPAAGKLDFPGGFTDPGESMEEALVRELREELGWQCSAMDYMFSLPNIYIYHGVVYHTVDGFFEIRCEERPYLRAADDVRQIVWRRLTDLDDRELAFISVRQAVQQLLAGHGG